MKLMPTKFQRETIEKVALITSRGLGLATPLSTTQSILNDGIFDLNLSAHDMHRLDKYLALDPDNVNKLDDFIPNYEAITIIDTGARVYDHIMWNSFNFANDQFMTFLVEDTAHRGNLGSMNISQARYNSYTDTKDKNLYTVYRTIMMPYRFVQSMEYTSQYLIRTND